MIEFATEFRSENFAGADAKPSDNNPASGDAANKPPPHSDAPHKRTSQRPART
jgi:hypothetical protein